MRERNQSGVALLKFLKRSDCLRIAVLYTPLLSISLLERQSIIGVTLYHYGFRLSFELSSKCRLASFGACDVSRVIFTDARHGFSMA
jgi:hypothetical protein